MFRTLSEAEIREFREKLCQGLDLAHKKMLKEKSLHNQKVVIYDNGKIKTLSARYLYRKLYGKKTSSPKP
ncbi:MAG: hypothetical protein J6W73_01575 [Verrucomicrobia bacterium]|jgi:hypothetical protein|nr:hypothetical protein [Verrucomicrobiota bacterium]MBO7106902.1 hypothetical protein [Verrucomicrobiota bacterium]MBR5691124.1 hypothetical protein [Verrucomicrobiota bacterium]